jgi:predicted sulfurtransferase
MLSLTLFPIILSLFFFLKDKAPSLKKFAGTHLEADEYHMAMQDPNTVIIDVRNAYESAIGAFQPPKGGAKLIDPKMRNSVEFPKWLNSKGTQDELHGKKVLMYW